MRLAESVGGVFDPTISSAIAVFEELKGELSVMPCMFLVTLKDEHQKVLLALGGQQAWHCHPAQSSHSSVRTSNSSCMQR